MVDGLKTSSNFNSISLGLRGFGRLLRKTVVLPDVEGVGDDVAKVVAERKRSNIVVRGTVFYGVVVRDIIPSILPGVVFCCIVIVIICWVVVVAICWVVVVITCCVVVVIVSNDSIIRRGGIFKKEMFGRCWSDETVR